ncbi:hypothetical protein ACHAWF_015057 [Thalassiosira exigua]
MSHASVIQDTLVSLPTGLGKTLVAAVVMYNFYRWFPEGKVVFVAPTRPLVSQQIKACYQIMGIPEKDTAEISGRSKPESRTAMWLRKRVFFCTPQSITRDIKGGRCPARSIVCLVMDEAHRATGEHANAVLVRQVRQSGAKFRLVGLSATPGSDIKAIQAVIDTLGISRIEARGEDDPSVKQYIHDREEEVIVVRQPDVVRSVDSKFAELMKPLLGRLRENDVPSRLMCDSANLTAWSVMSARQDYIEKTGDHSLDKTFDALRVLADSRQRLKKHGVQIAKSKLSEAVAKHGYMGFIAKQPTYQSLMREMTAASGGGIGEAGGMTATRTEGFENNPKLMKLSEVLTEHFERKQAVDSSTRAIVFAQWRESVNMIVDMLSSQNASLLKPCQFIGQASKKGSGNGKKGSVNPNPGQDVAGMNQAQQQRVLAQFKQGSYNVLVATCVGEVSTDSNGEVDLIVNFDVLKSAIRSVQRSGRTGRKRNGRVVFLVAEGSEERSYRQSVTNTKLISRALQNTAVFRLCTNDPMFPAEPNLTRRKMNVASFHLSQVGGHTPRMGGRRKVGNTKRRLRRGKLLNEAISNVWRLDAVQEEERMNLFGELPRHSCREYESKSNDFPPSLKRKYLNSMVQSVYMKGLLRGNEPVDGMGNGKCLAIVRKLERSYCKPFVDDAHQSHKLSDDISAEPDDFDDVSRSVDFGSDIDDIQIAQLNDEGCTEKPKCISNQTTDVMDKIFGRMAEDERGVFADPGSLNSLQLASIFDEANHKKCAVIAPPGMAIDESAEESESGESVPGTSSQSSIHDGPCPFFEESGYDFGVPTKESHGNNDGKLTLKTPFSDHDSAVDFGGNDQLTFGPPRGLDANTEIPNQIIAEESGCHSTKTADAPSPKKQWAKTGGGRMGIHEKENIDTQLPLSQLQLSPIMGENQSCADEKDMGQPPFHLPPKAALESKRDEKPYEQIDTGVQVIGEKNFPCAHDEVVASFRLPTPPPSSDDSTEDSSDSESEEHQTPGNASLKQCEEQNPVFVETCGDRSVSFFQLPTQYSSSSEDENDSAKSEHPSDDAVTEEKSLAKIDDGAAAKRLNVTTSSLNFVLAEKLESGHALSKTADGPRKPVEVFNAKESDGIRKSNNHFSCTPINERLIMKGQSASNDNHPECRHVQFRGASTTMRSTGEDLTDTPLVRKPEFSCPMKSAGEDLTDTPLAKKIDNSLMSLDDTPLQFRVSRKTQGQQRKRLRAVPQNNSIEKHVRTAEKLQRRDLLKQRIEGKYRCRFLDCEAADSNSEGSDEEDAIRQIEDEEMSHDSFINDTSQLGYTQDDLDRADVDAEIEVCDGATGLHGQFDHRRHIDNQFNTPILNRRMRMPSSQGPSSESSQKGLGNMNFIKSVLEHHRQGGKCIALIVICFVLLDVFSYLPERQCRPAGRRVPSARGKQ